MSWESTLAQAEIPAGARFSDIIVPTKDMARYTFLFDIAIQHGQPILFTGPTGKYGVPEHSLHESLQAGIEQPSSASQRAYRGA